MQPSLALSVLTLLGAQASASTPISLFPRQSSGGGLGLGSIPDACQSTCGPIETTINSCQELSCLCNNDVAKEIADCANCLVAVGGDSASSLLSQEQSIIDQYTNACSTSGEPISSIQVSSVAPSGSGSGGASATATGSGLSSPVTASGTSSASSTAASNGPSSTGGALRATAGAGAAILVGLVSLVLA